MQLVPRYRHMGSQWQPTLQPNRAGGYAEWGANLVANMKLDEALVKLAGLSEDEVVFARPPFSLDSAAIIGFLNSEFQVPPEVRVDGFEYFLDAATGQEVMEVFGEYSPSRAETSEFLFFYGENDAFPDWVYSVSGQI